MLRPDFAFPRRRRASTTTSHEADGEPRRHDEEDDGAAATEPPSQPDGGPWRLLGMWAPWGSHPLRRTVQAGWAASPVERLAALLRARNVPLGLVSDGRWWALVWAPRGKPVGAAVWDASLWSEEPETLAAFVALLERRRFLGVPAREQLPALLERSASAQEEVTTALGGQVRAAVEMLVRKLDELDRNAGGTLLADVSDDDLYAGVVTVMMRVVFLLFAEERRLLPSDDDRYDAAYSVGRLVEQLEQRAAIHGEQTLEHRTGAWHRLLAIARALHGGVAHEDLRLPPTAAACSTPTATPGSKGRDGTPPPVDDLTVLRMLDAVQYVRLYGERRRLTFRALDVEQIGYVYEGLLELEVRTATEPVLLLRPQRDGVDLIPASAAIEIVTDDLHELGRQHLPGQEEGHRRDPQARRPGCSREPVAADGPRRAAARSLEQQLAEQLAAFGAAAPARRARPAAARPGRRPVRRALHPPRRDRRPLHAPLAGRGGRAARPRTAGLPARAAGDPRPRHVGAAPVHRASSRCGSPTSPWAAARSWSPPAGSSPTASSKPGTPKATPRPPAPSRTAPSTPPTPRSKASCCAPDDSSPSTACTASTSTRSPSRWPSSRSGSSPWTANAPSASSTTGSSAATPCSASPRWTSSRRCTSTRSPGRKLHRDTLDFGAGWRDMLARAADTRRRITATPVVTVRDVEHKARLLAEAEAAAAAAARASPTRSPAPGCRRRAVRAAARRRLPAAVRRGAGPTTSTDDAAALRAVRSSQVNAGLPAGKEPRRPLHWPLVFPEVFADAAAPGFDALIGNPPFLGGQKISGALGSRLPRWLQAWDGRGVRGSADLAARFLLRADALLGPRGQLGYVTTNTLIEGDTLAVGLAATGAARLDRPPRQPARTRGRAPAPTCRSSNSGPARRRARRRPCSTTSPCRGSASTCSPTCAKPAAQNGFPRTTTSHSSGLNRARAWDSRSSPTRPMRCSTQDPA